jgi:citrate synthase
MEILKLGRNHSGTGLPRHERHGGHGNRNVTDWMRKKVYASEGIPFPNCVNNCQKPRAAPNRFRREFFISCWLEKCLQQEDVTFITTEWTKRNNVPKHVFDVIEALPVDMHPMTQFVIGVMAMQSANRNSPKPTLKA